MIDTVYTRVRKLTIPIKAQERILHIMRENREFEKNKEVPKELHVVYCNCSDCSIDDHPCDGYVMDDWYPNIIFVDEESRANTEIVLAHELIHIFQKMKYFLWKDEFEEAYKDRWFEKQAFDLAKDVSDIIKKYCVMEEICEGHEETENFLEEHAVIEDIDFSDIPEY